MVGNWADDAADQFIVGYYYSDATPLFPFGFGLSYSILTLDQVYVKHHFSLGMGVPFLFSWLCENVLFPRGSHDAWVKYRYLCEL